MKVAFEADDLHIRATSHAYPGGSLLYRDIAGGGVPHGTDFYPSYCNATQLWRSVSPPSLSNWFLFYFGLILFCVVFSQHPQRIVVLVNLMACRLCLTSLRRVTLQYAP